MEGIYMFFLTLQQVVIMFLLMLLGLLCVKVGFLHYSTVNDMTRVLLYIISPCVILNAFHKQKFTPDRLALLGKLFIVMGAIFAASILLSMLIFNKKVCKDGDKRDILRFSGAYTNSGFMGIPLAQAINGPAGVFCAVPYLVLFNLFVWTHGISQFKKKNDAAISPFETVKKIISNPNILASVAGFLLFLFNVPFPGMVSNTLKYMADLNTGLSMLIIGSNLATINFRELITDGWSWTGVVVRNFALPLVTVAILFFLPFQLEDVAASTTLLEASCPVASMAVMFSMLSGGRTAGFATKLVMLSTVVSMLSIPFMMLIGDTLGII